MNDHDENICGGYDDDEMTGKAIFAASVVAVAFIGFLLVVGLSVWCSIP
jgi:hypothetical protein